MPADLLRILAAQPLEDPQVELDRLQLVAQFVRQAGGDLPQPFEREGEARQTRVRRGGRVGRGGVLLGGGDAAAQARPEKVDAAGQARELVDAGFGEGVELPLAEGGDVPFQRADRALYLAKEKGRARVCTEKDGV